MRNGLLVLVALLGIVLYASVFVVMEGERGIVLQFGKVKRDPAVAQVSVPAAAQDGAAVTAPTAEDDDKDHALPKVYGPGLHFKVP